MAQNNPLRCWPAVLQKRSGNLDFPLLVSTFEFWCWETSEWSSLIPQSVESFLTIYSLIITFCAFIWNVKKLDYILTCVFNFRYLAAKNRKKSPPLQVMGTPNAVSGSPPIFTPFGNFGWHSADLHTPVPRPILFHGYGFGWYSLTRFFFFYIQAIPLRYPHLKTSMVVRL